MAWILERYERDDGESPVEDFINDLPTKVRAKVRAHLTHLEAVGNRAAAPMSEAIGAGLLALRVSVGRHEVRVLLCFPSRPKDRVAARLLEEDPIHPGPGTEDRTCPVAGVAGELSHGEERSVSSNPQGRTS